MQKQQNDSSELLTVEEWATDLSDQDHSALIEEMSQEVQGPDGARRTA
jgi:hypothetical protein